MKESTILTMVDDDALGNNSGHVSNNIESYLAVGGFNNSIRNSVPSMRPYYGCTIHLKISTITFKVYCL